MSDIRFDRLVDLPLREAWKHEAHEFTPWLAENIEHLSEAIGIPLELTGTEVAVETFSADILARNPMDDTVVLIENQLEQTDHTHLGQIMTYLAGLDAQTVVWIAPDFRQPHLSAIRWLNENTSEGFSFFAVKARVVRIGDSPFAPIFEVVEKPDGWGRTLKRTAEAAKSELSTTREAFWQTYLNRHPDASETGVRVSGASNMFMEIIPGKLYLGRYTASATSGVYLRGGQGQDPEGVTRLLAPHREEIERTLAVPFEAEGGWYAVSSTPHPLRDRTNWPAAVDFLHDRTKAYVALLERLFPEAAQ
ncbi:MAG: hypothetical protein R3D80_18760 [Paracoccaceae bacterium]